MKLMEIMQRSGIDDLGLIKSFLKSAFLEVESRYSEKVEQGTANIVADQRFYTTPPVMVNLLDVRVKFKGSDGITKYRKIPRIRNVEDVDQDGL